jgi:hypothetical protein
MPHLGNINGAIITILIAGYLPCYRIYPAMGRVSALFLILF